MKICVCGSMVFSSEMLVLRKDLEMLGHEVTLPKFTEEYTRLGTAEEMHNESVQNKVQHDLIRHYFNIIQESDAILVYNPARKGVEGYVGGNTFLEMAFAHVLRKPIFMQFPVPDMGYKDEMKAMKPIVINGDLEKIIEF